MATLPYISEKNGISIKVHAQPGAAKSEFCGLHDDSLKLRIAARAVDGEANKSLCVYLADFFKVSKNSVTIRYGLSSRKKTVFVEGKPDELIARILPLIDAKT